MWWHNATQHFHELNGEWWLTEITYVDSLSVFVIIKCQLWYNCWEECWDLRSGDILYSDSPEYCSPAGQESHRTILHTVYFLPDHAGPGWGGSSQGYLLVRNERNIPAQPWLAQAQPGPASWCLQVCRTPPLPPSPLYTVSNLYTVLQLVLSLPACLPAVLTGPGGAGEPGILRETRRARQSYTRARDGTDQVKISGGRNLTSPLSSSDWEFPKLGFNCKVLSVVSWLCQYIDKSLIHNLAEGWGSQTWKYLSG